MSFQQFADVQYIKTFDNNEKIRMGSFSVVESLELKYIRSLFYINGTLSGTEQVQMTLYSDPDYSNVLYQSNTVDIVDIGTYTNNFIGWIRFDFEQKNINKDITYYPAMTISNYTRNGDTFYIGMSYDFPFPMYDNSEDLFFNHPIGMQIFGYK